jgi:hypothetical protein
MMGWMFFSATVSTDHAIGFFSNNRATMANHDRDPPFPGVVLTVPAKSASGTA